MANQSTTAKAQRALAKSAAALAATNVAVAAAGPIKAKPHPSAPQSVAPQPAAQPAAQPSTALALLPQSVLTVTVLPKTARIAAARAAMGLPPHGHAATQSGAPHGHAATQPVRRSGVQGLGTATTLGIPVQHRATVGYGGYGTLPAAYAAAGFTQGTYNGNGPPINAHGLIGVRGKLPNGKQYKRSITMAAGCTLAQAQAIASNPQHPQMAAALAPLAGQRVLIVVHAPAAVAGYVQQAPLRSTAAPSTKPAAPAQPAPL